MVDFPGCLNAAGHGAHNERGAVLGIAADEDVRRILRVLGLQEAHGQETELGLDDEGLALGNHDRTTAGGVGLPVDFLDADAGQAAVLA